MCDRVSTWLKYAAVENGPIPLGALCPRNDAGGTLYECLDVKKCFGVSAITISFLPTFQEGGSRERCCALKAWQLLRLAALSGQVPKPAGGAPLAARGLEGESAARR